MLSSLRKFWSAPPPIASVGELSDFVPDQAAFIAQKCTVEYCRARSGLNWDKLFLEEAFREAMEISRWESYAAVLCDVALVVEGHLRPHAQENKHVLAEVMVGIVTRGLVRYPVPFHRPDGWGDVVDAVTQRLGAAQLAPPKPAYEIGYTAAGRVFETLPIHPRLRGHDRELITNNIRFGLCRSAETLRERSRPDRICRDIASRPAS